MSKTIWIATPSLEINLRDIQRSLVAELEWFTKSRFDLDKVLAAAHRLKYSKVIRQFLKEHLTSPNEDFVSYVASAVDIPIDRPEQKQQIAKIVQRVLKELKGEAGSEIVPPPDDLQDNTDSMPAPELYRQYWTAFITHLKQRDGNFKLGTASKSHFVCFPSGTTGIRFEASTSKDKEYICVGLCLWDERAKERYKPLEKDKVNIDKAISTKLKWTDDPKQKQTRIDLWLDDTSPENRRGWSTDPKKKRDWVQQHQWLSDNLELFYKIFKSRIDALKKEKIGDA